MYIEPLQQSFFCVISLIHYEVSSRQVTGDVRVSWPSAELPTVNRPKS